MRKNQRFGRNTSYIILKLSPLRYPSYKQITVIGDSYADG